MEVKFDNNTKMLTIDGYTMTIDFIHELLFRLTGQLIYITKTDKLLHVNRVIFNECKSGSQYNLVDNKTGKVYDVLNLSEDCFNINDVTPEVVKNG